MTAVFGNQISVYLVDLLSLNQSGLHLLALLLHDGVFLGLLFEELGLTIALLGKLLDLLGSLLAGLVFVLQLAPLLLQLHELDLNIV